jgi:uncharacterized protein YxeA
MCPTTVLEIIVISILVIIQNCMWYMTIVERQVAFIFVSSIGAKGTSQSTAVIIYLAISTITLSGFNKVGLLEQSILFCAEAAAKGW